MSSILISIASVITALGTIIGAIASVKKSVEKTMNKGLDKIQAPLNDKINKMDIMQCRIFLINHLEEKIRGVEKSEYEEVLAHEIYEHYTSDLKSNSYVHDLWNKVYKK